MIIVETARQTSRRAVSRGGPLLGGVLAESRARSARPLGGGRHRTGKAHGIPILRCSLYRQLVISHISRTKLPEIPAGTRGGAGGAMSRFVFDDERDDAAGIAGARNRK